MSQRIDLVVGAMRAVARDVVQVDLRSRDGKPLPGAAPGAHIQLHLPSGLVRAYSLVNALGGAQQDTWRIAVGWDANSRGGSHWIHEKLRVGQALAADAPRNLFAMEPSHRRVLLLAGGIGITPVYAMAQHCQAQGLEWEMLACARSSPRLAYLEELRSLAGDRLETWFDDERGGPVDLRARLAQRRWDAVYACGPAPMLEALVQATAHWPEGSVRLERFKAEAGAGGERRSFELVLQRSGLQGQVGSDESVLDALERLGVPHPYACREGLCGSCDAPVLDGQVEHHDSVLSAAEKQAGQRMLVCVSRCGGSRLVLDL